jgi:hypothetical protein
MPPASTATRKSIKKAASTEQFRIESIIDRVNTTGTAFLGLTIGCSQCHDHKFDPLTQKEFYGLFAFLNNAEEPDLPLASPEEVSRAKEIDAKIAAYIAALPAQDAPIWDRMLQWERSLTPTQRQAQSQAVRESFDTGFEKRSDEQKQTVLTAFVEQAAENKAHQAVIKELRATKPTILTTMIMSEMDKPRRSYLFLKGDFTRDGGTVGPTVPAVLHRLAKSETTNRLDLAKWMVDPRNPLMARVTVNRLWQQYFGKGIVETEMITTGIPPTHPELLDWLAAELMAPSGSRGNEAQTPSSGRGKKISLVTPAAPQPWSLKHIHRLIVNSATYRQSSRARPDLDAVDPNNKLLARQHRFRLDAEIVRDAALSASGLLNPKLGGPSVFPPIPDGVMSLGQLKREWKVSVGDDRYRRGLYTFYFRATPPELAVFERGPSAPAAASSARPCNATVERPAVLNWRRPRRALFRRTEVGYGPSRLRLPPLRRPRAKPDEKQTLQQLLATIGGNESVSSLSVGTNEAFAAWTTVARSVEPRRNDHEGMICKAPSSKLKPNETPSIKLQEAPGLFISVVGGRTSEGRNGPEGGVTERFGCASSVRPGRAYGPIWRGDC